MNNLAQRHTTDAGARLHFGVLHSQGHPSHGGNEAEIFIIPILGGEFGILGGTKCFCQFKGEGKVNNFLGGRKRA